MNREVVESKTVEAHSVEKETLLSRLEGSREAPCFILAPRCSGQEELMAAFLAQRTEPVLLYCYEVDEKGDCTCREQEQLQGSRRERGTRIQAAAPHAGSRAIEPSLARSKQSQMPGSVHIAHFSWLPWLDDKAAQRFSDELDALIEAGCSVIVCTPVQNDRFQSLQSDRLEITARELKSSGFLAPSRYPECLAAFAKEFLPLQIRLTAVMAAVLETVDLETFAQLGYEVSADVPHLLERLNPLFEATKEGRAVRAEALAIRQTGYLLEGVIQEYLEEQSACADRTATAGRIIALSIVLLERGDLELSHHLLALGEDLIKKDIRVSLAALSGEQPSRFKVVRRQAQVAPLQLRIFGELEVHRGGALLRNSYLSRTKVRRLLIYLALNRQRVVSRESLVQYLWPDLDAIRANKNLYTTWCLLAKGLGSGSVRDCPYIERKGELFQLNDEFILSDIRQFEENAHTVLFGGLDINSQMERLLSLESLYQDSLVADLPADGFIKAKMDSYRQVMVDAFLLVTRQLRSAGELEKALFCARAAFELDESREDVYRDLMDIQFSAGQRTSAMQTYFSCKRYLSDELGILPSKRTTALYQDLLLDNCR